MMIQFIALPTPAIRALQAGGLDAYGNPPERKLSSYGGVPCRHCLRMVAEGRAYLVAAYRPFTTLQPYAETGPIFLCADACDAAEASGDLPEILDSPDYIVRGYGADECIVYGTGGVTPRDGIIARAQALLARKDIAFVDVRSARNNCFQCRIVRA
jgi:hypothetical protein